MHAYDFILVLFSFVYAAAITHILSTAGELIIAAKRIQLSWFNAGWMLGALLFTCAWWIGLWDLHTVTVWSVGAIAFYFFVAAGIYLNARLVSPRVPERLPSKSWAGCGTSPPCSPRYRGNRDDQDAGNAGTYGVSTCRLTPAWACTSSEPSAHCGAAPSSSCMLPAARSRYSRLTGSRSITTRTPGASGGEP